jgi:hypothetical protein
VSFDNLLNLLCNIEANTPTQDAAGQMIESWAAILSNIPCRLDPAVDGVVDTPKAVYEVASHILFMREPTSLVLTTKDHRVSLAGVKYNILLVSKVYGYAALNHLELILEKVE